MTDGGNAAAGDAIAGLLFLARAFPQRLIAQREHCWLQLRRDKAPADVEGQTVLIAGGGAVAAGLARFARALTMRTIGVARDALPLADCDETYPLDRFDALLPRAQWLVIVAGDVPSLDARRIGLLPRGAQFVSVADAKSFDAPALSDALQNGQVASAYLAGVGADSPLRALPNVMFARDST